MPQRLSSLQRFLRLGEQSTIPYYVSRTVGTFIGGAEMIGLRHRQIDDRLRAAYDDGVRQVVILGAGYDSRAHRLGLDDVHFVEIDHPLTQEKKRQALASLNGRASEKVEYLSVDFMQDWAGQVRAANIIKDEPTFAIWEGVTYYLNEAAIKHSLAAIRTLFPAGSRLIFDAYPADIANPNSSNLLFRISQWAVESQKEPFLWGLDREDMQAFLEAEGYSNVSTINLAEVADRLRSDEGVRIMRSLLQKHMYLVETRF